VGSAGRRSFATIGDTTNLGSRLMSAGDPGQVVISDATRTELAVAIESGQLVATGLGPLTLKGKREPVQAWVIDYPSVTR